MEIADILIFCIVLRYFMQSTKLLPENNQHGPSSLYNIQYLFFLNTLCYSVYQKYVYLLLRPFLNLITTLNFGKNTLNDVKSKVKN